MEVVEKMILNRTVYLIEVIGELDIYAAPDFRKRVLSRIQNQSKKVLFDLTDMDYIDSSGVGAFIKILQELKMIGGHHRVINMQAVPQKVFELSNIISLINESVDKKTAARELGEISC